MNRRNLLTAAAASVMLPGAELAERGGRSASTDAELLARCAEYVALMRADRAAWLAMTEAESLAHMMAQPRPWSEEAKHTPDKLMVAGIARLPARTLEGMRAKATALIWYYGGSDEEEPFRWRHEDALIASVLDDVMGRAGA